MKKIFKVFLCGSFALLMNLTSSVAQDLIVTTKGDTLHCKILGIEKHSIKYSFKTDDGTEMTTEIDGSEVKQIYSKEIQDLAKKESAKKETAQKSTTATENEESQNKEKDRVFRIYGGGAYSYRLGKSKSNSPLEKKLLDDLRSGYEISAGVHLFITPKWAAGADFHLHKASAEISNYSVDAKMDVDILYIGPSFLFSNEDKIGTFDAVMGLGYVGYTEKCSGNSQTEKFTSSTIGITGSAEYLFKIGDHFSIGPKLGIVISSASIEDKSTKEEEGSINLSTFNLGIVLAVF